MKSFEVISFLFHSSKCTTSVCIGCDRVGCNGKLCQHATSEWMASYVSAYSRARVYLRFNRFDPTTRHGVTWRGNDIYEFQTGVAEF